LGSRKVLDEGDAAMESQSGESDSGKSLGDENDARRIDNDKR
jgi:hypothetical protein